MQPKCVGSLDKKTSGLDKKNKKPNSTQTPGDSGCIKKSTPKVNGHKSHKATPSTPHNKAPAPGPKPSPPKKKRCRVNLIVVMFTETKMNSKRIHRKHSHRDSNHTPHYTHLVKPKRIHMKL